jgi:hypothetical protein
VPANTLDIIIRAKDEASSAMGGVLNSTKKLDLSLGGLVKTAAIASAAVIGSIVGIGVAVLKMGARSNDIADVSAAFKGLAGSVGESSDTLLAKLRTTTGGMIPNFDLMMTANTALRLNVVKTGDELAKLIDVGARLAESMGGDYRRSAEQFAEAIARGRATSLMQFGIDVQAVKSRVDALGITMEDAAQQGRLYAIVMDVARETLARTGKDTQELGDAIDWLGSTWQNMKDTIAMSAGPLANDIAASLSGLLDRYGPAIQTLFTGFFETLRGLWRVAKETVRDIATAMGLDMDALGPNAQTWGENVILKFAQGLANGFTWVVGVLNQLGDLIAYWLAPGSPPRILPDIDEWGREAIQAYVDGMGKGINFDQATKAMAGIQRFFDLETRPLTLRLGEIGHERSDIEDAKELARLQRRMGAGFANPNQERLMALRIEELQVATRLRDVEAERDTATTKASDILFPLEREVVLTKALTGALAAASAAAKGVVIPEIKPPDTSKWFKDLPGLTLGEEFAGKMDTIFAPLRAALGGLVQTWAEVFGGGGEEIGGAWVAGMEQGASGMGPGGSSRSLGAIMSAAWKALNGLMKRGLAALTESINDWWEVQSPIWEGVITEWLVSIPQRGWEKFLDNQQFYTKQAQEEDKVFWDALVGHVETAWRAIKDFSARFAVGTYNVVATVFEAIANAVIAAVNAVLKAVALLPGMSGAVVIPKITIRRLKLEDALGSDEAQEGESSGAPVRKAAIGADFITRGPQLMLVGEAGRERVQVTPFGKQPAGSSVNNYYNLTIHTNAPVEPIIADFAMLRAMA